MDTQGGGATGALGVRTPSAEQSVLAVLLEHSRLLACETGRAKGLLGEY